MFQLRRITRELQKIAPDAHVIGCRKPKDAPAIAASEGCDVLLSGIDLGKDKYEGLDLAKALQKINPRVNIIFITGYAESEVAAEVVQMRISGFVRKPYRQEQLAEEFAHLRYAQA
jgi:DNA-binding LytR/AlgR family response regulator